MQETAQEYRQRIIGYTEGRDPIKLQASAVKELMLLLNGVPTAEMRKRPAPGKWSVAEIVAHLADTEIIGSFRIRMILGAPGTPISGFDQDDWVVALHYDKRDIWKSLDQFRAFREANLSLFKLISPEQWMRSGVHSERGEESVGTLVRMYAGHDINHIRQIERILKPEKH